MSTKLSPARTVSPTDTVAVEVKSKLYEFLSVTTTKDRESFSTTSTVSVLSTVIGTPVIADHANWTSLTLVPPVNASRTALITAR